MESGGGDDAPVRTVCRLDAPSAPGDRYRRGLTGDFVARYPERSRAIAAAGHRLGNHSVDHPHFPALGDAQIRAQVRGAEEQIIAVTGADARPFFRFPYGDRTAHTIAAVNQLGYTAVRWTVNSLGWQGTAEQSAARHGCSPPLRRARSS